ncbi:MAG: site-specific integrase [Spirochaetaceae bacterium]|jgi:integrase|nr:site-specific integrase [Spirochaetaceae bacterium]
MLKTIRFTQEAPDKPLIKYVADFWTSDSPYVRECAQIKKKPLSAGYIKLHHEDVKRHIEPFQGFRGVTLRSLTAGKIRDWMTWAAEKGMSGRRINTVLQSMRIAVRYAVSREELDRDPFKTIGEAEEQSKEKGVLTPGEVSRLIHAPVTDPRTRLAVLLGILCGLRRGEVRGICWGDIGEGIITVCHNWIDGEGIKAPKCKGGAIRENKRSVPFPASVALAIEAVRQTSTNPAPDCFVFEGMRRPGEPLSNNFFRRALASELVAIGIDDSEQRRRNLSFHGLRHSYITLGRLGGISDIEIQALAGHRSGAMMERYSHASQVLDFEAAREKLEKAIGGNT